VPEEGYQLTCGDKGYFVPADTTIGMSAWVEQFDEEIFPEPEEFKPSRWLGPDNGTSGPSGDLDRYLVAFSKGTRQCGGMNLAYMEMFLALAAMIIRFRVNGEAEPGKEMVQKEQFVGLLQVRDLLSLFCPLPSFCLRYRRIRRADDAMCSRILSGISSSSHEQTMRGLRRKRREGGRDGNSTLPLSDTGMIS
jgi:hypothetical protein